jgi:heptosyltransferase-3
MTGRFSILYIAEREAEAAVLSSGVLAYLVGSIPGARITVVGSSASAPLFADTPGLDRLIVSDGSGRLATLALWWKLRGRKWSLIVDQRGGGLSGWLTRERRAVRGMETGEVPVHAVEAAAHRLKLDTVPAPRLYFGDDTREAADALIGPGTAPILAIGPGVDWIGKRWPAERFAKVATPLLADGGPLAGARLLIVGDEAERDAAHTIRFATTRDRVIEAQGKLTPLQTVAALSRASLFIGADSYWTQLAVAAGVPTLAVFGPSDEAVTSPWGGRTVRGPRVLDDFRAVDPNLNQAIQHMMDLPVEPVLAAARAMLDSSIGPHMPALNETTPTAHARGSSDGEMGPRDKPEDDEVG